MKTLWGFGYLVPACGVLDAFKADARTCLWGEGSRGDGDGGVSVDFFFARFINNWKVFKGNGEVLFLFGKRN